MKKSSVTVAFSNGESVSLSFDAYSDLRLYAGKEIEPKEMALIKKLGEEDQYYSYAVSLLSSSMYTTFGLRGKLMAKGADKATASSIVRRLVKEGLLNDEEYAHAYLEEVASPRLYGKQKAIQKLKEKGISAEILASLPFDEEEEYEKALKVCASLNRSLAKLPTAKKKEKAYATLIERGYEGDIARRAIEEALESTPSEIEDESLEKDFELAKRKFRSTTPLLARKRKIYAFLARKGYHYEKINALLEDMYDEDQ